jgi:hypothetical protein
LSVKCAITESMESCRHSVQVVHEGNAAAHFQETESRPQKGAFTIGELQDFFDYADKQVTKARDRGRKAGYRPSGTQRCSRSPTASGPTGSFQRKIIDPRRLRWSDASKMIIQGGHAKIVSRAVTCVNVDTR